MTKGSVGRRESNPKQDLCLGVIVVDRTVKVARCYFRPIPLVGGPAGELVEGIENAKRVPDSLIPLRKVGVPGTGRTLIAQLFRCTGDAPIIEEPGQHLLAGLFIFFDSVGGVVWIRFVTPFLTNERIVEPPVLPLETRSKIRGAVPPEIL